MTDNNNTSDANEQASTSSGAAAPSSTAPAPTAEQQGSIMARLFDRMALERQQRKEAKQKYAFWETQPVVQFTEGSSNVGGAVTTAVTTQ